MAQLVEQVTPAPDPAPQPDPAPAPQPDPASHPASQPGPVDERRPLVERVGLGAIALLVAVLFGVLGVTAWSSGELFLGAMAGIGALMTVWAAASTLRR